jgi:hypothetical protein
MKYDCLLVNGDSYTEPTDTLVWADHLGLELGVPVVNLAIRGSNNKRILRSTIEYLESDHMLGKSPLVVIGWSFLRRLEVWYYGDKKELLDRAPDNQDRGPDARLRFITLDWLLDSKEATDYHKNLIINSPNELHKMIVDFYTDLFLMTRYLKSRAINYFFFSSGIQEELNPYWFMPATDLHLCYSVLNDPAIINFSDFSLAKWSKENDPNCREVTHHLSPEGHKKFSHFLKESIHDIQSHS